MASYYYLNLYPGVITSGAVSMPGFFNDDCPIRRVVAVESTTSSTSGEMQYTMGQRHEWLRSNCDDHGMCQFIQCAYCGSSSHKERALFRWEKEMIDLLLKAKV